MLSRLSGCNLISGLCVCESKVPLDNGYNLCKVVLLKVGCDIMVITDTCTEQMNSPFFLKYNNNEHVYV